MPVDEAIVNRALAAIRALSEPARTERRDPAEQGTTKAVCDPPEPIPEPEDCGPEPVESEELKPLGAERGFLTLDDMPELQRRLEFAGWKVERHFDQLVCWTPGRRKPRIQ